MLDITRGYFKPNSNLSLWPHGISI
uniref:Uncharacterized protein n=1 Tax=Rhizophora mucronata TaxID=61149 RepID=A0A2P2NXU1_RHIMU